MEIHIKIIGVLLILLSLVHFGFPRYFNWKEDLMKLSLINRQMMIVHTFFVALTVFLIGLFCLTSSQDLIFTDLGKKVSLAFGVFWAIRLFIQFFGYSSVLWKGKKFETVMHVLFSILWTYLSVVFLYTYFS